MESINGSVHWAGWQWKCELCGKQKQWYNLIVKESLTLNLILPRAIREMINKDNECWSDIISYMRNHLCTWADLHLQSPSFSSFWMTRPWPAFDRRVLDWIVAQRQLHTPLLAPAPLGSVQKCLETFQPSHLLTFQPSNHPTFSKSVWKQGKRQPTHDLIYLWLDGVFKEIEFFY